MVKFYDAQLDRTFSALADPTRRALLARLEQEDGLSVSELAKLLTRTKVGRTVSCHLNAGPMEEAMGWLARYQRFWTQRLDALAALLDARRQGRE